MVTMSEWVYGNGIRQRRGKEVSNVFSVKFRLGLATAAGSLNICFCSWQHLWRKLSLRSSYSICWISRVVCFVLFFYVYWVRLMQSWWYVIDERRQRHVSCVHRSHFLLLISWTNSPCSIFNPTMSLPSVALIEILAAS